MKKKWRSRSTVVPLMEPPLEPPRGDPTTDWLPSVRGVTPSEPSSSPTVRGLPAGLVDALGVRRPVGGGDRDEDVCPSLVDSGNDDDDDDDDDDAAMAMLSSTTGATNAR